MSATPRIDPIRPRSGWLVLSDADSGRLDASIMEVLAEVGVRFPLARALDALARGGCREDRAAQVARLPEDVVRVALRAAPKAPLLAARDPACDLTLACSSAPATMAGNLVVNLAAMIAGTVLLQRARARPSSWPARPA